MAAVTGLTMIKRFTYRGDATEEFANTYHFKGPPPGDNASWGQLWSDTWAREGLIFPSSVHLVQVYGYDSDDPNAHHVYSGDLTDGGTSPGYPGSSVHVAEFAGDQAACVWWKTARLNSRGKPIYLRKYFHAGDVDGSNKDQLDAGYRDLLDTFSGTGPSGIQSVHGGLRSQVHDESVQLAGVIPWVTTRTLKRRGKRPKAQ